VQGSIQTRPASVSDLDALLANVQAGFDSYTDFAPPGWRPPDVAKDDREWMTGLLTDPETWALLALVRGRPAGHVSFFPARERQPAEQRAVRDRPLIPGLAQLWQLFVLPAWWGKGVAAVLHDAALTEMRRRGFERARLYTPSQQNRARRFYERRGWSAADERFNDDLELPLTQYRRRL
jgi:GNAT superfamily N-acetyltransferase